MGKYCREIIPNLFFFIIVCAKREIVETDLLPTFDIAAEMAAEMAAYYKPFSTIDKQ